MALGDIFRVDFTMVSDDRNVSVSQHYLELIIRTGTQEQVSQAIAEKAEEFFWTDWLQLKASDELAFLETRCQQIFPTRQAPFVSVALLGEVGAILTGAMNGTTAVLIGQYGVDWSRNFQGRMYVPGLPEADADSGRIKNTPFGSWQALVDIFMNGDIVPGAPAGGTYTPVVFSPTLAKAIPLVLPVHSLMGETPVRPRIATQRRRRTNIRSVSI